MDSGLYGVFLNLAGRRCLVVGGGPVAARKITGLLACHAEVTVVAPTVTDVIAAHVKSGSIRWEARAYQDGDAARAFLVIAATDSIEINRRVYADAEAAGRLCNVVNDQTLGNCTVPAVVRRGRLQVAVSTGGAAPAVAKRIRRELEVHFGEEYVSYLDRMAEIRQLLLGTVSEEQRRTKILQAIAESDLLDLLRTGREEEAEQLVQDCIGGYMT
ncbi:precorrin-2 dehydrogenase/sirohydrochlorin ferrochelatase family protein [Tumebacillus permanentifrigoris]|uniref:precorrin-2 dehydrogenase n=1 Tax=Tumebacillus permanentifrigoris TaxID=378543 RepID=A0A316DCX6_9BACL|nr:bifunctional precorrin-2 dehydrogenase/sirohydrochlorin ferrochelatase [Tumebacillus permanentifrigoris]PWK15825.1 precorrin-2 dehydrogenase [Tumebacillus permanentifrigoris]